MKKFFVSVFLLGSLILSSGFGVAENNRYVRQKQEESKPMEADSLSNASTFNLSEKFDLISTDLAVKNYTNSSESKGLFNWLVVSLFTGVKWLLGVTLKIIVSFL